MAMTDKKQSTAGVGEKSSLRKFTLFARVARKLHLGSHGKHKDQVKSSTNGVVTGGNGTSVSAPSTSAGPPSKATDTANTVAEKDTTATPTAVSPPSPAKPNSAPTSPITPTSPVSPTSATSTASQVESLHASSRRTGPRAVVPGLPRQQTFARQISEQRTNLQPVEEPRGPRGQHGRASSRSLQPLSQSQTTIDKERKSSDPAAASPVPSPTSPTSTVSPTSPTLTASPTAASHPGPRQSEPQILAADESELSESGDDDDYVLPGESASGAGIPRRYPPRLVSKEIEEEMEWKWILNLSMHFRDQSQREKFFVTYQESDRHRRRITISCDYREASEGSLEQELSGLKSQRDKSAKIYEAIRDSLRDIRFYNTITNLKLQTAEGRLHVHVTEDANEVIHFPPTRSISHLKCAKYRESDLKIDSHLSGFVYKVVVNEVDEVMIMKEIPGPDTIDEFLYEINALYALADSDNVIHFKGCVVDDTREYVKGLLISFAPKGALVDTLYNDRGKIPWSVRERWAKQIVIGLSEIHEAGYVQGDFTLSNMVIDADNSIKIIDINRRGCPVGWEPPEVHTMIDSLLRITMYIGVKSDIFQLGMVLWGIAHENDEPETETRPLTMDQAPDDIPAYFREIVEACLCDKPQGRPAAKDLIDRFPEHINDPPEIVRNPGYDGRPIPSLRDWNNANGYFPPPPPTGSSGSRTHTTVRVAPQPSADTLNPTSPTDTTYHSQPPTITRTNSVVSDSSIGGGVAVRNAASPGWGNVNGNGMTVVGRNGVGKIGYETETTSAYDTTTEAEVSEYEDATEDGRDTPTVGRGVRRWVDAKEVVTPI